MFVHDTRKVAPDVTGGSPKNAESSCSNKPNLEQNSPKADGSKVSEYTLNVTLGYVRRRVIPGNWGILL